MDSIDVKFTVKEKVKGNISAKGTVSGFIYPKGPKGDTGNGIESIIQNEDYTLTIIMTDGTSVTTSSIRGLTGNGIVSIEKTSTEGLIDTYTITYTDGNTDTFAVTNANTGSAYTKTEVDELLEVLREADSQTIQELNNLNTEFTSSINQVNTKIDNLSKNYKGTNITASTIDGYGRLLKIYGKTEETGTGEKSPDNPYELKCVGDAENLFNKDTITKSSYLTSTGSTSSSVDYAISDYIPAIQNEQYTYQGLKSVGGAPHSCYYNKDKQFISSFKQAVGENTITVPENACYIRFSINISATYQDEKSFQFEKGPEATTYKNFGENLIEIISKNGENITKKQIACKPLCCLKDNDNNIIAQDYIDFTKNIVHRELDIAKFNGTEEWTKSSATDADRFVLYTSYDFSDENIAISNILNHNSGEDWSNNEFRLDNYNGHRVILNFTTGTMTLEQLKAKLAQSNLVVIFKRGTAISEHINCSDTITQFKNETTIYNTDSAEIEIALTENKAISDININCSNIKANLKKIQEENKIVQANDFVTAVEGYTIEDINIFKQNNHYWGTINVRKNSGFISNQGNTAICNLKETVVGTINSSCVLASGRWASNSVGYLYIANKNISVADNANSNQYNYVRINIDVVTQ